MEPVTCVDNIYYNSTICIEQAEELNFAPYLFGTKLTGVWKLIIYLQQHNFRAAVNTQLRIILFESIIWYNLYHKIFMDGSYNFVINL